VINSVLSRKIIHENSDRNEESTKRPLYH